MINIYLFKRKKKDTTKHKGRMLAIKNPYGISTRWYNHVPYDVNLVFFFVPYHICTHFYVWSRCFIRLSLAFKQLASVKYGLYLFLEINCRIASREHIIGFDYLCKICDGKWVGWPVGMPDLANATHVVWHGSTESCRVRPGTTHQAGRAWALWLGHVDMCQLDRARLQQLCS